MLVCNVLSRRLLVSGPRSTLYEESKIPFPERRRHRQFRAQTVLIDVGSSAMPLSR